MLSVEIKDLSKSYGKTRVLERVDLKLQEPECYALTGKSGGGKTTLLRLLLGLELPDSGEVIWKREGLAVRPRLSAVFQEDRLCEGADALENVLLVMPRGQGDPKEVEAELRRLLPGDALGKPVAKLSGGQRRRVAILRAMCAPGAEAFLLDEPFTGLDETTRLQVIEYVKEKRKDRLLLIATHGAEDIGALGIPERNILGLAEGTFAGTSFGKGKNC